MKPAFRKTSVLPLVFPVRDILVDVRNDILGAVDMQKLEGLDDILVNSVFGKEVDHLLAVHSFMLFVFLDAINKER
jgi:hypothetical protein